MNGNRKFDSQVVSSMFAVLLVALMFIAGAHEAVGQACPSQSWSAATPNIWASDGSIKVMLNNNATTNQPTIPIYADDGNFNPWGFEQHPQTIAELNDVWSCPSGTPLIAVAGAGRETVSFQVFISAGIGSNSALSGVSVAVSPLTGSSSTITSDNTGTSNVTRYLEGYVAYSGLNPQSPGQLQVNGQMPDPLIPFYDPYDSGNPAVATPFNVQSGTTQGVWVNVSIPASQAAGTYNGTVTVTGTGIGSVSIPVQLTVWNGNLPTFDAGSVSATYADMLKSWIPFYGANFDAGEGMTCGGPGCTTEQALFQKYQIMGHNYDVDIQIDGLGPTLGATYPTASGTGTSYTVSGPGSASTINWTAYDAYVGPALTPGGLFSDGTYMRVFDSPLSTAGGGAWAGGGYSWYDTNYYGNAGGLPPSGLLQLFGNYATQISQHFASNHTTLGWGLPELISYTYDETYGSKGGQLGGTPLIYQNISLFNEAVNSSNSALSPTWAASTAPIHNFLTDEPACQEDGDNVPYTDSVCADHINLSYPGGTNATAGYTNSWVINWSSNPSVFMPGQPGPPLNYGYGSPLIAGTGYKYTQDLTEGVPALSTAPVPIERWFYQGGDPFSAGDAISATGVGFRANYWIAYKYGLDETIASTGDPSPAAPAPSGVWDWVGDYWGPAGDVGSSSSPSNCAVGQGSSGSPAPSPFVSAPGGGDGVIFYPGNEVGCYYTTNPVGAAILTASPAVNTSCTSNGYSVCNGISGPVASMRLEAMRRGYEDYEYMYLLGKKSGRSAPLAIVNSMGGADMTAGGLGTTSWNALDWENTDGPWYAMGVLPESAAYTGNCVDSTAGVGGLANGLPNGPTGAASSGLTNYVGCPGEWTNNPYRYEAARVQLAQALGFAPASTTPVVSAVSPTSGVNSGGTSVVITGSNFTSATTVEFGGVSAASFTINSATSITAVTSAGNGTVDVQVFGPGGVSLPTSGDLYSFVSPVTVTGVSPSSGLAAGGNVVTISGTDFSAGAVVMFGNNAATNVVVSSATSITATSPAGSNTVNVTVTTSQGTSATDSSNLYVYDVAPTVTGLSPNSGTIPGGTSVTISGTGFVSGMTVAFGGTAASSVVVNSTTSATATSPASSSRSSVTVDVRVTTTNGTSAINSGDQFTYTSPVTVTGLSVHSGAPAGGTSVVITGTDFTGATAVLFGGNAAASFAVNSATQITATSPAGGGTVDVTVAASTYNSAPTRADQFSYSSAINKGVFATLPTTAVGSTSTSQNVSITLQSASPISSITVPKAQNGVQEFTVGTVSGCTVGGASNASGTVCQAAITFSPQYPGIRTGTLMVNNDNSVVGTAGLAGIGQGPEVAQTPGSLVMAFGGGLAGVTATPQSVSTAAFSVSNNGSALAIDGAGNLYIADNINCMAYKVIAATNQIVAVAGNYNFSSGAVTPSTTPEPALGSNTCPQGIAVDGAGNIYIVDAHYVNGNGYPNVVEEVSAATGEIFVVAGGGSSAPSTTAQTATSVQLNGVNSLATDTAGNVYVSDFFNNLVEKLNPAGQLVIFAGGGSTAPSTTPESATSAALNGPTGMVMDASGNFYISDQNIGVIEKVNSSGQIVSIAGGGDTAPSTTPQSALSVAINNPAGLAVDGANLYIADFSNNLVERVNPAGQLVVVAGGGPTVPSGTAQASTNAQFGNIQGVEVDGAGNLYIADGQNIGNGNNMVEKMSTTAAPLSFPFTNVGSSSVPQSINLTNIGNETLTLSGVSATTDFPLQTTGTCTVTATNSQSLASGTTCSLAYTFHPTVGGVLNETATLTDNNLNATSVHQGIALAGTAVGGANPQLTGISPSSGSSGTSVTVTGTNLSGATEVTFGTTSVTPSSNTSTSVTATAPTGSGTVSVTVTTSNGTSNGESFTYTATAAATPTFSPAAGAYTSAQTVTISDTTPSSTIYYTTDGTTPTSSSSVYSGSISVSASETVKAIATATGYAASAVGSAAYTINVAAATPTFSPAAGTFSSPQTVTISSTTASATIYYTTNGTTPTTASTVYSGPITVSATETVKAIAGGSGYTTSAVGSAVYTLKVAAPSFSPAAGTYNSSQTVTVSTTTPSATIYYTTNGTTPTTASTVYSGPITVSATETVKAIAAESGYTTSAAGSAAYTLKVATPTFSPVAGTYSSPQTVTVSTTTPPATIYYTTNGSTPTTASTVYSGPITVSATETVKAIAVESGYTTSAAGSAAYTITFVAATPTFSPGAGTYSSPQTVTVSTTTPSATIYYTTNGSAPTTGSTVYSGPITVSTSETVMAIAAKTGYTTSAVGSAAYTISTSGGGLPVTDAFSGSGALSSNWTNTTSTAETYVAAAQASGTAVPSVSGQHSLATYTGVTFPTNQYAQVVFVTHSSAGGSTGPCVHMSTTGNGYCYLGDEGIVYLLTNGTGANGVVAGCPIPASGDTIKLSVVGTTFTCTDITTGISASATDSTYSAGNPGMLLDQRNSTVYALAHFQAD